MNHSYKPPMKVTANFPLALLFILYSIGAAAQNQVRIQLKVPPANRMALKDLWSMKLINTTRASIKIYLEGNASESKDGLLIEGKTREFTVSPGEHDYGYDDFKNGSATWKNRKYEEIISRTGSVPSGEYTFCVTAYGENGDIAGQENCIDQLIEIAGDQEITLVQPDNGEKADPKSLTFMWTPLTETLREGYSLKIVEIRASQSADEAMNANTIFFSRDNIRTTSFQYPLSARKLEPGKKYAWQVIAGNLKSQVYYFIAASGGCTGTLKIDSIRCNGVQNGKIKYHVCATYSASAANTCNILFNNPTNITTNNFGMLQSGQSAIFCSRTTGTSATNFAPPLNTLTSLMSPGSSVSFCFDLLVNPGTPGVKFTAFGFCDDNSGNFNTANANDTIQLPTCFCDPCKNMNINASDDALNPTTNVSQVNLTGVFANLNTGLIKKITAEIIFFDIRQTNDTNCARCVFDSKQFGNFVQPASPVTGYYGPVLNQPGYSRLITWTNQANKDCSSTHDGTGGNIVSPKFSLPVCVPDASKLKCCADIIKICVRYTFYDYCCHSCELIKCYEIKRTNH